jgi:hypothetical protein
MKLSSEVVSLKVTSISFQNGGRSDLYDGYKICTSQFGTITFLMMVDLQRRNNFKDTISVRNKK